MPRTKRRTIPGVTYHLISRFVDREWFISSELERSTYLDLLGTALKRSSWRCLGYAVMSNHIHLAMLASDEPLAAWIRHPHSAFADWMNRTHKRIGSVFVRGPKSILIPDGRVGHLLAYIHNNPVRAKLVEAPGLSTWTSHRYYIDPSEPSPRWLRVDEGLRRMDLAPGVTFDGFVRTTTAHPVLGEADTDEQFWRRIEEYEKEQLELVRPRPPGVDARALLALAAAEAGLTPARVCSKRRGLAELRVRAAVIVCGARFGLSTTELAECLHITPQAVTKTLRRDSLPLGVEDLVVRMANRASSPCPVGASVEH